MILAIQSRLEVMGFTPSYTANGPLKERYLVTCVTHHVPENSIHSRSHIRVESGVSYERWWLPVWTRVLNMQPHAGATSREVYGGKFIILETFWMEI